MDIGWIREKVSKMEDEVKCFECGREMIETTTVPVIKWKVA